MNEELVLLCQKIREEEMTCIVAQSDIVFSSKRFGVLPLVELYQTNLWKTSQLFVLADKLLGKGAALFLIQMGCFKEVYGRVVTEEAYHLLTEHKIKVHFDKIVPHILNRTKSDLCPIEKMAQYKSVEQFQAYYDEIIDFYKKIGQL
ncbi:MAG TPA: hypothetical protein DCY20_01780 [Firmicutes bacterium]|nr:hypothetical protein [Bacillota bacterium]